MQFLLEEIPIIITQRKMKNIYLRICQKTGEVKVSASKRIPIKIIKIFVNSKISWIKKHRTQILIRLEKQQKQKDDFYFLGQKYLINLHKNQIKNLVEENAPNQLTIYLKQGCKKEKILEQYCKKEFLKIVKNLAEKWQKIINVNINEVKVRKMKTRFGSCNINTKKIWLSLNLARENINLIEYVLVHEIVHLLERRHNQNFKNYMTYFLPNWRELELKLKETC